jgi:hypothetical protein
LKDLLDAGGMVAHKHLRSNKPTNKMNMKTNIKTLDKTSARICPKLSGFTPEEILAADKVTRTLSQISKHPLVQDVSDLSLIHI